MLDKSKPYGTIYPSGWLEQNGNVYKPNGEFVKRIWPDEAPVSTMFVCDKCNKEFTTAQGLRLHGRKAHVVA